MRGFDDKSSVERDIGSGDRDGFEPLRNGSGGASEPELEPEQEPELRERRRTDMPFAVRIGIAVAAAVVAFAFFWELMHGGVAEHEELPPNHPPQGRSEVQDAINRLDWVERNFLPLNENSRPGTLLEEINGIVIHFIGNPNTTADQNRNYFANLAVTRETFVSSNFIIDLDGKVLQIVPVDEIAYASNHRNSDTLSIELCHPDETGKFTAETYASAVRLTAWLCVSYGLTADDVIRHYDVVRSDGSQKACPAYFVENEDAWHLFKENVTEAIAGAG